MMKYVYGPVPSRRPGFSLGVDVIPYKVCTLDCIYCQLGRTTQKVIDIASVIGVSESNAEKMAESLTARGRLKEKRYHGKKYYALAKGQ